MIYNLASCIGYTRQGVLLVAMSARFLPGLPDATAQRLPGGLFRESRCPLLYETSNIDAFTSRFIHGKIGRLCEPKRSTMTYGES